MAAARNAATKEQLQLVDIDDMNRQFAFEWGVLDARASTQTPEAKNNYTQMLMKLQAFANGLPKDITPADYKDLVLGRAAEQLVNAPDPDAWLWGTRQQPLSTLTGEAELEASVTVAGENIKIADITRDARSNLQHLARQQGILNPNEDIADNPLQMAELWVAEGRPRPYAGIPGSKVTLPNGVVMDKVQVLSDPQGAALIAREIPGAVLVYLTDALRVGQAASFGVGHGAVVSGASPSPDMIWNRWLELKRPTTVEAAREAAQRKR